jgi:hypothetical protein
MTVDRRLLNWGVFLVLVGGIPLAVSQGWIDRDVVARAWELWPFILIGAGIGLLLAATPLRALGGVIVAATIGTMVGAVLAVGFGGFSFGSIGCGAGTGGPQIVDERGTFDGGSASVTLEARCAEVSVTTGAGAGWALTVNGAEDARPTVAAAAGSLAVRSPEGPVVFPFNQGSSWRLVLGTDPRLDLSLQVDAGSAEVDLAGATVGLLEVGANAIGDTRLDLSAAAVDRVDVEANAADLAILLPTTADLSGDVRGNAASIELCAADEVGLRFRVEENITASNNFAAAGLIRSGDTWESPGYAAAAVQVDLRIGGGAVSYALSPQGGCR